MTLLTLCDKEIEHGKNHSVAAEHVVTARVHSRQGHPKTAPYGYSSLQFGPHVTVNLKEEEKCKYCHLGKKTKTKEAEM